ncbi:MAG: glycoside hydrolase family 57 protein [Phycisphaerales bacterium]|nr:MAG: glycoside hydrolase family 57 protein [Phycisphaerales bacterium]
MASVCFYFQVHQPYRLGHYTVFDDHAAYFDEQKNATICRKVAEKCYLPANRLMLDLVREHGGGFKVAYSMTGVLLEQLQRYCPEVLGTFQELAQTGCVEFLAETYYHSLSFLHSHSEFLEQVDRHVETVETLFGQTPRVFRNTELIYCNALAEVIEGTGRFDGIITEGVDHLLGYRSPNFVYQPPRCRRVKLLLKNYRLSDDIAFRFSNRYWSEWPLRADRFGHWISQINGNGYVANLFMDYETFGEHQWHDTGIFEFLRHLPAEVLKHPDNDFKMPSEVLRSYAPVGIFDVPHAVSWADRERDLSAWLGNPMQASAADNVYGLEDEIKACGDSHLLEDWRRLQTSDHFYYMCTKYFQDGDVHKYFSPYDSPYEAYINYVNVLDHVRRRCSQALSRKRESLSSAHAA